jgi:beta-lactamase class A
MRFGMVALALTLGAASQGLGQASPRPTSGLQRLLDAEIARYPGKAGVWVKHLTTGEEASVRGDEAFQ